MSHLRWCWRGQWPDPFVCSGSLLIPDGARPSGSVAIIGLAAGDSMVVGRPCRDTPEEPSASQPLNLARSANGLSLLIPCSAAAESLPIVVQANQNLWKRHLHRAASALLAGYFRFGYVAWILLKGSFFTWSVRGFDFKSALAYAMLPFFDDNLCLAGGVLKRSANTSLWAPHRTDAAWPRSQFANRLFLVLALRSQSPVAGVSLGGRRRSSIYVTTFRSGSWRYRWPPFSSGVFSSR